MGLRFTASPCPVSGTLRARRVPVLCLALAQHDHWSPAREARHEDFVGFNVIFMYCFFFFSGLMFFIVFSKSMVNMINGFDVI
jgi:hypothetical protein